MIENKDFRILSLDGGGSKGVYTLGILKQVEALVKKPLYKEFDLIYGTSTGSIIAALLGLGFSVDEVAEAYFGLIPKIMTRWTAGGRTEALKQEAWNLLGEKKFDEFLTNIGIVAINYELTKPMIFKSSINQAHGSHSTFQPGFGCPIAEAVIASSAAYPFFNKVKISTKNQGDVTLIDGGFIANNPTLLAIADAVQAFNTKEENIKVLSLGTGLFKERVPLKLKLLGRFNYTKLFLKLLEANTTTIETLRIILFRDIPCVRINGTFLQDDFATNLLESNIDKLKKINALGKESFSHQEVQLKTIFGW